MTELSPPDVDAPTKETGADATGLVIPSGARAFLEQIQSWLFDGKRASYGVAVLRIGFGLILGVMLLVAFRTRHFAWGAGRDWAQPRVSSDAWWSLFDPLFGADISPWMFDLQYLGLITLSVLLVLGWRSRIVVPLTLIGFIALIRTNPFISDGGLQLFRIALVYLCLVDTSLRWSLDSRRRRTLVEQGAAPERRLLPAWWNNLLHNTGILLLVFQMCIVYVASSMFKIQGSLWQEGTAIYYVLQLDEFATWPQITSLIDTHGVTIGALTYLTVFVQLFFPFLLLNRATRIVGLIVITMMHLGIGIFMGLMYFSFTMIAIDMIFIRDVTWRAAAERAGPTFARLRSRLPGSTQVTAFHTTPEGGPTPPAVSSPEAVMDIGADGAGQTLAPPRPAPPGCDGPAAHDQQEAGPPPRP